jgi:hypothetical protein
LSRTSVRHCTNVMPVSATKRRARVRELAPTSRPHMSSVRLSEGSAMSARAMRRTSGSNGSCTAAPSTAPQWRSNTHASSCPGRDGERLPTTESQGPAQLCRTVLRILLGCRDSRARGLGRSVARSPDRSRGLRAGVLRSGRGIEESRADRVRWRKWDSSCGRHSSSAQSFASTRGPPGRHRIHQSVDRDCG